MPINSNVEGSGVDDGEGPDPLPCTPRLGGTSGASWLRPGGVTTVAAGAGAAAGAAATGAGVGAGAGADTDPDPDPPPPALGAATGAPGAGAASSASTTGVPPALGDRPSPLKLLTGVV